MESGSRLPTIPPADVHLYKHDTDTSLVDPESFTAMLNSSREADSSCGNESSASHGGSFFTLHTKLKLSVPVGLFPDMAVDYDHGHHPIDSAKFGFNFGSESGSVGFNFDFNAFDFNNFDFENMMDVNVSATFDYKQAFMEAALSIDVEENMSNNFPADSSESQLQAQKG